jgi:ABC-type spermidine/putrescine transport system permease subunit I
VAAVRTTVPRTPVSRTITPRTTGLSTTVLRTCERIIPFVPLAWLALFFVGPLVITVIYSFAHSTFGGVTLAFSFENFRMALSGFYLQIFLKTLEFAALGTLLAMVVAMPAAYAIARKAGRYKSVLLVAVLIPFWTSFLIRTLSWQILLAPGGHVQAALNFLHLHSGLLNILNTRTAVFIGIVYGYLPLMLVPLFVSFERVPAGVIEASKDLGAGRFRTFWNVTLPLVRPGVATGILLTFVPMTGEFVIPQLLGGDKGVLMGSLIATQYLYAQNLPLGSAMAVLLLLVLGMAVVALMRLTRGFAEVPA